MSRSKKLLILLLVLAVTAAAAFAAVKFGSKNDGDDRSEISILDSADVTSISWKYKGSEHAIIKDGENSWLLEEDKGFDLDTAAAAQMLSCVSNLYAVKEISKTVSDKADYGLDEPELTVTVKTGDDETVIFVGDYNTTSGYYYMMYSGSDALYYVDDALSNNFAVELEDIVTRETLPEFETDDVSLVKIAVGGKEYTVTGSGGEFSVRGSSLEADDAAVSTMITSFMNISWEDCVSYDLTDKDLEKYGLADPEISFTMSYTYTEAAEELSTGAEEVSSKTLSDTSTLLIGAVADKETNSRYAMLKGGKNVYTVSETTASAFLGDYPGILFDKTIIPSTEQQLVKADVTYKGRTYSIDVTKTVSPEETGTEATTTVYTLDGKNVDLADFISDLNALKAQSVSETPVSGLGGLMISVTLTYEDGSSAVAEIYEYSDSQSAAGDGTIVNKFCSYITCDDLCDAFRDAVFADSDR